MPETLSTVATLTPRKPVKANGSLIVDKRQKEDLLRQMMNAHERAVRAFAARYEFDRRDVEEVVDDAFMLLFEIVEQAADLESIRVRRWLMQTVRYLIRNSGDRNATRRKAVKRLRREPFSLAASSEDEFFEGTAEADRVASDATVREALQSLAPSDQRVLVMRSLGYRYAEVATAVGFSSPGAARQAAWRARMEFRSALEALTGVERSEEVDRDA